MQSIFNSLPGRCAHRAGSKTRVPDSDVVFSGKTKMSYDRPRRSRSCVSMIGRDDTKLPNRKNPQHCSGAAGTSTRAVACALTSKPQPLLILHSTRAVACTVKNLKSQSSSSFAEVISPATLCFWVCGTAKIRYTRRTCENNVTQVPDLQHSKRNSSDATEKTDQRIAYSGKRHDETPYVVSQFPQRETQ